MPYDSSADLLRFNSYFQTPLVSHASAPQLIGPRVVRSRDGTRGEVPSASLSMKRKPGETFMELKPAETSPATRAPTSPGKSPPVSKEKAPETLHESPSKSRARIKRAQTTGSESTFSPPRRAKMSSTYTPELAKNTSGLKALAKPRPTTAWSAPRRGRCAWNVKLGLGC